MKLLKVLILVFFVTLTSIAIAGNNFKEAEIPSLDRCQVKEAWNKKNETYPVESIRGWISFFWGDYREDLYVTIPDDRDNPNVHGFEGKIEIYKIENKDAVTIELVPDYFTFDESEGKIEVTFVELKSFAKCI